MNFDLIKYGVTAIIILAVVGLYFRSEHLAGDNRALELELENANLQIISLRQHQTNLNASINKLFIDIAKSKDDSIELKQKLSKHNLELASIRHPKMITEIMDKGTENVFRKIEAAANN